MQALQKQLYERNNDVKILEQELALKSRKCREKDDLIKEQRKTIKYYKKRKENVDRKIKIFDDIKKSHESEVNALKQDKQKLQNSLIELLATREKSEDVCVTHNMKESKSTQKPNSITPTSKRRHKTAKKLEALSEDDIETCVVPSVTRVSMNVDDEYESTIQSENSSEETEFTFSILSNDEESSMADDTLDKGKN